MLIIDIINNNIDIYRINKLTIEDVNYNGDYYIIQNRYDFHRGETPDIYLIQIKNTDVTLIGDLNKIDKFINENIECAYRGKFLKNEIILRVPRQNIMMRYKYEYNFNLKKKKNLIIEKILKKYILNNFFFILSKV